MKYYDWSDIIALATKQLGGWCVYIGNDLNFDTDDVHIWDSITREIHNNYPEEWFHTLSDISGKSLKHFNTREEAMKFFEIFNVAPVYASACYAAVYGPSGCITTNT